MAKVDSSGKGTRPFTCLTMALLALASSFAAESADGDPQFDLIKFSIPGETAYYDKIEEAEARLKGVLIFKHSATDVVLAKVSKIPDTTGYDYGTRVNHKYNRNPWRYADEAAFWVGESYVDGKLASFATPLDLCASLRAPGGDPGRWTYGGDQPSLPAAGGTEYAHGYCNPDENVNPVHQYSPRAILVRQCPSGYGVPKFLDPARTTSPGLNGGGNVAGYITNSAAVCMLEGERMINPPPLEFDGIGRIAEHDITCSFGLWFTPLEDLIDQLPEGPDREQIASLTRSLEQGVDGSSLISPDMKRAEQCLSQKLTSAGLTYSGPTGTIRTAPYQQHFRELYNVRQEFDRFLKKDDRSYLLNEGCKVKRRKLDEEVGCRPGDGRRHCIVAKPANGDSRHQTGNAIDMRSAEVSALRNYLSNLPTPKSIASFLSEGTDCNLDWGGNFSVPDPVHFQLKGTS